MAASGPLQNIRVIEIAGIGPTQYCGMLLADLGAKVLRVVRPEEHDSGVQIPERFNLMNRSRHTIALDLKAAEARTLLLDMCGSADALLEGFRPGVMESLELGPAECQAVNSRLVYGRMTGWGQEGPLRSSAGHDGNYAGLSGALGAIGPQYGAPTVPLNLVADFGGGGAMLAIGVLAAVLEAQRSARGQVVDAAMVDGAASMMTLFYGLHAAGLWADRRESNLLDGGAPFYRPYRTSDGKYMMLCAIEPKFFREFLQLAAVDAIDPSEQYVRERWPDHVDSLTAFFGSQSQDIWTSRFAGSDACVSPVLSLAEAPRHPHNVARETFIEVDGIVQPAPAPRFSRTPNALPTAPGAAAENRRHTLMEWGLAETALEAYEWL